MMFRKEAISAFVDFMRGSSILVELEFGDARFCGGRKTVEPGDKLQSKMRTNNKLNPNMAPGRNPTRVTLVGGERSNHCTIPAPKELANKITKEKPKEKVMK